MCILVKYVCVRVCGEPDYFRTGTKVAFCVGVWLCMCVHMLIYFEETISRKMANYVCMYDVDSHVGISFLDATLRVCMREWVGTLVHACVSLCTNHACERVHVHVFKLSLP